MRPIVFLALCLSVTACAQDSQTPIDPAALDKGAALAKLYVMVDGHVDVPYRMTEETEDISQAAGGHFDYPRAVAGGLDAPFMSIYIPAARQKTPGSSKALADSLIDMVEGFVEKSPDKFALAYSVADVRENFTNGVMSLPMGMENGAGIEDELGNLEHFYGRGIRYITLTHSKVNLISDSSYDSVRTWNGLSEFGKDVVREMNRLGIMVDISHVSDSAFYDAMEITEAPAIASHSSARRFTPGWERNMSDPMIEALAENGGVIMVNFGCAFLSEDSRRASQRIRDYRTEHNLASSHPDYVRFLKKNTAHADVQDAVDHINHIVALVGIDHVGLGSDFDGVTWLPMRLEDVSQLPNLIALLVQDGYSDEDIAKIMGENVLRVWSEVEAVAAAKSAAASGL